MDLDLLKKLQEIRNDFAKRKNFPPYVIFPNATLEAMATNLPTSIEELAKLPYASEKKAKKYGKPFLEYIQKYKDEN